MKLRWMEFLGLTLLAMAPLPAATVDATVFSVTGLAQFAPPHSATFAPLTKGMVLPVGTTVRTGADGYVVLTATPGSAIEIGNRSLLKINELAFAKTNGVVTERHALLELNSGVVGALIDPSTPNVTDFKVKTPQGSAAARGTFYAVQVYEGKTYVSVRRGKVETMVASK